MNKIKWPDLKNIVDLSKLQMQVYPQETVTLGYESLSFQYILTQCSCPHMAFMCSDRTMHSDTHMNRESTNSLLMFVRIND